MATTKAAEKKADAPAVPFPPLASGIEDGLRWEEVEIFGERTRFREITVDESDTAYDLSENPDKSYNPRLNQRLELAASVVSPKVTIDDMAKWSIVKLRAYLYVSQRVNTLPPADAEGNA